MKSYLKPSGFFYKWNLLCFTSLLFILISPVLYRAVLYGTSTVWDVLLTVVLCLPMLYLLMGIRKMWMFFLLTLPLVYFSGNETFVVVVYHHYMKAANVVSMFITNSAESGSFVSNNTFAVMCDVPILLLWFFALYAKHRAEKPNLAYFFWAMLLSVPLYLLGVASVLGYPPYNLPNEFREAYLYTKKKEDASNHLIDKLFDVFQDTEDEPEKESYVLFIGESVVYDHLSLAGYQRPTTPRLDSCSNLTLYSDYYSNATLTMLSVPMIMSRSTPETFFNGYAERNILGVYKESGFKTFVVVCLNHLDSDPVLCRDADSVFICKKDIDIPLVVDSLVNIYPKTFFVLQGLGNHCYFYNFEEEDNVFHPNQYYDKDVKSDSLLFNAYDNTLRYTDRVVAGVIKAIDKEDMCSGLVFAADHGENVNPGDERRSVSMDPMKSEYHVPLIIWRSDLWRNTHAEKDLLIDKHKDMPTSADNVFYTVCEMADIRLNDELRKDEWNLMSKSFKPHQRTLLCPDGRKILELK